ncbi:hypothetical protein RND81_14G071500 [Saponaria officinalis]|uniref:Peptidase A1 domain-containing protein n=1 Tax=Saponaria officinalis TaxID=3572 RepID=A0AAW1GPJ5_SAPOF
MNSTMQQLFVITTCLFLHLSTTNTAYAATQPRPKALVIPTSKDTSTLQYIIKLNQRTPPVTTPVAIDLKTRLLWSYCTPAYVASRHPFTCNSPQCALTNSNCRNTPSKPDCTLLLDNPFKPNSKTTGQLVSDIVRINSTNGSNVGRLVSAPNFLFGCAHDPVQGLAKRVKGIAGFGRSKTSISAQFASNFGISNTFALCLNSNWSTGVAFFGDGRPYRLYPGPEDISTLFSYTPLITNPKSPSEYFITVSSIIVNQTTLQINKSLLSIDPKTGYGGTKISTTTPYTTLQSSIYKTLTTFFDTELRTKTISNVPVKRVNPISPFTLCYDSNTLFFTRIGVVVPEIKLVFQNNKVVWTFYGGNSMIQVNNNVMCLGIVDGGMNAKTAIVIGGYQIENNLLEFDLGKNRLGFTSSLQNNGGTTCGNFNFTLV